MLVLLAVLFLWLLLSVRPGPPDQAWQRARATGRLLVGVDPSYPPFETLNNATGELEGYDVDLAEEIGRRLGLKAEFVLIGFDSLYDAVIAGKIDAVISGMPYDPNWTEDVAYGLSYFNAGQFLVVRNDESQIESIEDLAHRRLGVELRTTADLEARRLQRQISRLALETYSSADASLVALQNRVIDAALVDAISAYLFISNGGDVRLLPQSLSDESYAVVTKRKSVELRAALDKAILEMTEDGSLDRLRDRWLLGRSPQ